MKLSSVLILVASFCFVFAEDAKPDELTKVLVNVFDTQITNPAIREKLKKKIPDFQPCIEPWKKINGEGSDSVLSTLFPSIGDCNRQVKDITDKDEKFAALKKCSEAKSAALTVINNNKGNLTAEDRTNFDAGMDCIRTVIKKAILDP